MIGQSLAHFQITAKLGAGGMGEVYRATDSKLGREVAIKVLPEAFTADPERLARFDREAKLLASLNHPNVAGIYEVGADRSTVFLAMELVEGEDLSQRLSRGALSQDEALEVALQIARALEVAHARGIIHRDLKPANVKLGDGEVVKILDFGLAKAWAVPGESSPDLSHSPTLTVQHSGAGVILGTAAYMSPEQARGEEADQRSDIWSLGVLLYEMLTGRKLIDEPTISESLAAVLKGDLDLGPLPPETSPATRRVLNRCLERDPDRRFHSVADVRIEIEDAATGSDMIESSSTAEEGRRSGRRSQLLVGATALALGAALTWLAFRSTEPVSQASPTRYLSLTTGPINPFFGVRFSADGESLVYGPADGGPLQVRRLDQPVATAIPGTEGGMAPFFSADGSQVGFASQDRFLKRIPLRGGLAEPIGELVGFEAGAHWTEDDTIYFSHFAGERAGPEIFVVPAVGGEPRPVPASEDDEMAGRAYPTLLPGGRGLLHLIAHAAGPAPSPDRANIAVFDLGSRRLQVVLEGASRPKWSQSGHILAVNGRGELLAAPFDPEELRPTGPPARVLEGLALIDGWSPSYDISSTGTLAYLPDSAQEQGDIVGYGTDGSARPLSTHRRNFEGLRYSRDGNRLAVLIQSETGRRELWLLDIDRDILTPFARAPGVPFGSPVWFPDGDRIVYWTADENGDQVVEVRHVDEPERAELLLVDGSPESVSPDGRLLVFTRRSRKGGLSERRDLWLYSFATGSETPLLVSGADEGRARISPDGKWVAYESDRSGQDEILLLRLEGGGPQIQVSTRGGGHPVWRSDGRGLYFVHDKAVWSVAIELPVDGGRPRIGTPEKLFELEGAEEVRGGDIRPDGEVFAFSRRGSPQRRDSLEIVLGFFEILEERAPAAGKKER